MYLLNTYLSRKVLLILYSFSELAANVKVFYPLFMQITTKY